MRARVSTGAVRAVISLGTNTTRLLIVREFASGGVEQLEARQIGTRLGEGLRDGGTLSPAGVERTLAAVGEFMGRVRVLGGELVTIATSAMRRADDGAVFAGRMRDLTGVELQILDGAVEAEASFRGATFGTTGTGGCVAVIDVGGGSTECAVGTAGELGAARSIEIGSVRVTERFPELSGATPGRRAHAAAAAARIEIAALLEPFAEFRPVSEARCVAGTPLTIAAVATASHVERVSGTILTLATLDATLARLLNCNLETRRSLPGMLAQRADIIVGGGLILSEALRALKVTQARLEANDLLLGFLLMQSRR